MDKNIVIIDGNYLTFRSVYSNKDLTNSNGMFTGGTFGFLRSLVNYRELGNLVVVFDGGKSIQRTNIYPSYKSNRQRDPEIDAKVKMTIKQLNFFLPLLAIPVVQLNGFEGDDIVFKLMQIFKKNKDNVIVVSDDSDYYLYLQYGCKIFRPRNEEFITEVEFKAKFGFDSTYYDLYLAIVGTHNNVSGVLGLGPKRVTAIIKELKEPTIESLLQYANSNFKYSQKIKDNFPLIKRNILLINPKFIQIDEKLIKDQYETNLKNKIDIKNIFAKFGVLEFNSLSNWIAKLI